MSVIFISIGDRLFRSPVAARFFKFNGGFMSRACFSSVHQPQKGGNWVDDIRKGADNYEEGRSDISENRRRTRDWVMNEEDDRGNARKGRETADTVGDMAKEGAVKAMETGIELGEKAKETMDIAWDGFKETTKNARDSVVGNDDDSPVSLSDDGDSHVHNLRKRAGGYDLQDK